MRAGGGIWRDTGTRQGAVRAAVDDTNRVRHEAESVLGNCWRPGAQCTWHGGPCERGGRVGRSGMVTVASGGDRLLKGSSARA